MRTPRASQLKERDMKTLFTKAALALALGATALTSAAPAEAQRYGGGYRHDDGTGTAIIAGIAGLAIGAAIASSSNRRDGYYEDRGYYDQRGYDYRRYHRHHWRDHDRDRRWDDRDGRDGYYNDGYNGGGRYYGNGY
jgi:hypothetical protein